MKKTCKECTNLIETMETRDTILFRCRILGLVSIKAMDECKWSKATFCCRCGKPILNPWFWRGDAYCSDCFNIIAI